MCKSDNKAKAQASQEDKALNAQIATPQEDDIVPMILNERKNSRTSGTCKSSSTAIITGETFFLDNNPMGAMTKDTFKCLTKDLSESQLQELQVFIRRLNEGEPINFKPIAYGKDENKKCYASIRRERGTENFQLPVVDNLMKFLVFYMNGKINCQFTMSDLYTIIKN